MANIKLNNQQEFMNYINNPANYKKTRKKQYQIWACMPEVGTKITNVFEQKQEVTDAQHRFVLSGTQGEQYKVEGKELVNTYNLASGMAITSQSLASFQNKTNSDTIDWFKIVTKSNGKLYGACFIPMSSKEFQIQTIKGIQTINKKGVSHGRGDFVVCEYVNGRPDFNSRLVVNGKVFADTYDNRGFTDYLVTNAAQQSGEVPKPKTLIMGTSSQAGVAVAQKTAREIVTRLKSVGSEVPAKMQEICALRITDFKYACKSEQVSDDLGKKLLSECRSEAESRISEANKPYYSRSEAFPICYRASIQAFGYKHDEALKFVMGLHEVACFDVIELVECRSLHIAPKKHSTRFVIASGADGKYYCLFKPTLQFSFIIAPLDGSVQLPLADDVLESYVSWIPTDSLALLSPIKNNLPALIKPELAKLATPIDGIEFVKVTPMQLSNDSRHPIPNHLYEIHGTGKNKEDRYGYCAIYEGYVDEKQVKRLPRIIFQYLFGDENCRCMNYDSSANIFDVGNIAADFIWQFVHRLREFLGETRDEQDKRTLNSALALRLDVASIIEHYSKAVKSGAEMPATILTNMNPSSGTPLKDILIDKIILPSDKLTVDFNAMEDSTKEHFRCNIIMLLVTYAIIKLYEQTPNVLQLRDEPYGFGIEGIKDDGCRLMLHTANKASFAYSWAGLVRWEIGNDFVEKNSQFGDVVDSYDLYTKYFKSGKTFAQVADACYSHVSALASLRDYVYKTLRFGTSDKNVMSDEDIALTKNFMTVMTDRLQYIASTISANISVNCGLRPKDVQFTFTPELYSSLAKGREFLADFRKTDKKELLFKGSVSELTGGRSAETEAFVKGARLVSYIEATEDFYCKSLGFNPIESRERYVLVRYNNKLFCISMPEFTPYADVSTHTSFKYLVVPLNDEGKTLASAVDMLIAQNDRWIPFDSSETFLYFVDNVSAVTKALAPQFSEIVDRVIMTKISATQANKKIETPKYLYEIKSSDTLLGYFAAYDSLPKDHIDKPEGYFYDSLWSLKTKCPMPYTKFSIYEFSKEICDIARSFVNSMCLMLGEIAEQYNSTEQLATLKASLDMRYLFSHTLKLYSDAAWNGCCRLPDVMMTDYNNLGAGTPVKNMPIEQLMPTSEDVDLKIVTLDDEATSAVKLMTVKALTFASLAKCYEHSPYTFLLRRDSNDLFVTEDQKSFYLRAGDAFFRYTESEGFAFGVNEQVVESTPLSTDLLKAFSEHFKNGTSLFKVASGCFKMQGLGAINKYITKVMSYAGNDKAVKGLLIEGISFYYNCFNVSINSDDCKAFLTDATKDTVRAELHFEKYATDSGEKMQTVLSEDTTTLFFTFKEGTLIVRGKKDNRDINRTYKLGNGVGIGSLCARSFIDVCRSLKLHPAKVLYSSKSLWKNIFKMVQIKTPGFYYRLTNLETSDERSNIDVRIQIAVKQGENKTNSQFKVLGERTIRIHLNYEAFDMTLNTTATMASFNKEVNNADVLDILKIKVSLLGASTQLQQEETGDSIMYPSELAVYLVQKIFTSYFADTKKYSGMLEQR